MDSNDFPAELARKNADPANWTWSDRDPQWVEANLDLISDDFPDKLAAKNADPANWTWTDKSPKWIEANQEWKDFATFWYGNTSDILPDEKLSLGTLMGTSLTSILVRKCYVTTFDKVWLGALLSEGIYGTTIIGQPGIGKTLLDLYIIIRLLQLKQVILFTVDGAKLFLFYHGIMLVWGTSSSGIPRTLSLPQPTMQFGAFMWSIFDICDLSAPPPVFMVKLPCSPIQTTSPNPSRYKIWSKQESPVSFVLPLWTRDELLLGLSCQQQYGPLVDVLCSRDPTCLNARFPNTSPLFADHAMNESSWQDDLEYLLDEAIYHFGYAARDVYDGVFNFTETIRAHNDVFNISYNELKDAVHAFNLRQIFSDTSLMIVAMSALDSDLTTTTLSFKSEWIAKVVLKALRKGENAEIAECIRYFRAIPGAQRLAGRFLAAANSDFRL